MRVCTISIVAGVVLLFSTKVYAPHNIYRDSNIEIYLEDCEKKQRIDLILKTIKWIETNNNYTLIGKSGEYGAYQFTKTTWNHYCNLFFNKNLDIKIKENQDKIALLKVTSLVNKGYSNKQIASIWNSGSANWNNKIGINKKGVRYNTPHYVSKFDKTYKNYVLQHKTAK